MAGKTGACPGVHLTPSTPLDLGLRPPPRRPAVAFWGQVLDIVVTAVFFYPLAGFCSVVSSDTSGAPLIPSLDFSGNSVPGIGLSSLFSTPSEGECVSSADSSVQFRFPQDFPWTEPKFPQGRQPLTSTPSDTPFQNINHTFKGPLSWKGPLGSTGPELLLMRIYRTFC